MDIIRKNVAIRDRLIVSVDVSTRPEILSLCSKMENSVSTIKLGLEVIYSCGLDIIRTVKSFGYNIMLDAKLHDIPNTVSKAACAITSLGVSKITIHSSGGPRMLKRASEQVGSQSRKLNITPPLLFAVTILTSLDNDDLAVIGYKNSFKHSVLNLAKLSLDCGISGIVCSPNETAYLREKLGYGFFIATPGIRLSRDSTDDQKRTSTPYDAIKNGADFLVVGRSVTSKPDPPEAIREIFNEIKGALE